VAWNDKPPTKISVSPVSFVLTYWVGVVFCAKSGFLLRSEDGWSWVIDFFRFDSGVDPALRLTGSFSSSLESDESSFLVVFLTTFEAGTFTFASLSDSLSELEPFLPFLIGFLVSDSLSELEESDFLVIFFADVFF